MAIRPPIPPHTRPAAAPAAAAITPEAPNAASTLSSSRVLTPVERPAPGQVGETGSTLDSVRGRRRIGTPPAGWLTATPSGRGRVGEVGTSTRRWASRATIKVRSIWASTNPHAVADAVPERHPGGTRSRSAGRRSGRRNQPITLLDRGVGIGITHPGERALHGPAVVLSVVLSPSLPAPGARTLVSTPSR